MTQVPGATIKLSEMPKEMENFAIFCAQEGLTKLNNEQELAGFVRKEFEGKFGPTWNCFVGRNFGSFVTHEEGHYIYFYVDWCAAGAVTDAAAIGMSRRPTAKQTVAQEWCTPKRVAASCDFFRTIQDDVISWWREHQRTDLPWRPPPPPLPPVSSASASRDATTRTPLANPYEVWVSEVMSQQTRMETVIPYFNKWMEKFPSIEALAASSEEEVKAVWAGMGYYRRALYLHKGAQYLLEWTRSQPGHDGALPSAGASMPSTQRELLKVPGIGPYTSAAVASLCFGEAVCSVDGNVVRVLSRLRGERGFDPKIPANVKWADAWGQELMGNTPRTSSVVCRDPSALNQGLMELGASVCKPGGAPLCASCPLQVHCCAYALLRSGEIDAIEGVIPVRAAATAKRTAKEVCVVHEVAGGEDEAAAGAAETSHRRFIVVRRPSAGLLASMLEFPTVVARAQYEDAREASQLLKHPLCALPVPLGHSAPSDVRACGSIRHIFSHILLDVHVLHVRWPAGIDSSELCHAVAGVIDDHVKRDGEGKVSSAGTRMSLMSEAELRRGAPSRLMLKVLEQVSSSEEKRIKNASPRQQKPPATSLTAKAAKKRSRS